MTKQLARPQDAEAGAFIGFDSSTDSDISQDGVSLHIENFKANMYIKIFLISLQYVLSIVSIYNILIIYKLMFTVAR
jgi:hypothetical protein